jgi:hypothetical protein
MYALYKQGQFKSVTIGPGLIGDALNGIGSLLQNAAKAGWEYVSSQNPFQPGGWGAVAEAKQKQSTAMLMGMRQAWDGLTNSLPHGTLDVLLSTGNQVIKNFEATDPDKAAQIDLAQSEIIRQRMLRETASQKTTTDVRDLLANTYKAVGLNNTAAAISTVQPDSPMVQTMAAVFDPTNLVAPALESVFAKTMRAGVRMQRFTESQVALSEINDRVAAAALARTNGEAALGAAMSDASRSKIESDLARVKTLQSNMDTQQQAAAAAHASALAEVNDQMTRMAQSDPARGAAAALAQTGGKALGVLGKAQDFFDALPDVLSQKILPEGTEVAQKGLAQVLRRAQLAGMGSLIGLAHAGPAGALIGGFGTEVVDALLKGGLTKAAHNLSSIGEQLALGQGTVPFMRSVADKTTGLTNVVASKLDNASIAPLVAAVPRIAVPTGIGMGIGGVMGYLQSGGDPRAAAQGAGTSGVFGMMGGLGQIGHYNSLPELRQARIADRGRFIKTLSPQDHNLFTSLHPEYQLAIGSYAIAHPDLDVHFFADKNATNGKWLADLPRGQAQINVLGDNPMHAILAHEIGHHIAAHELGDTVDAYMRGNPITGRAGLTTQLDSDGNPMTQKDPITGKETFVQNPQFEKYKADYNARLLRDSPGHPPVDDYTTAQEIFADMHAHYIENPELLQKSVRGHVPSDIVSESMLNNFLHKTGFGTDAITGNPIATSNLEGAKGLQDILKNYYKERQYKKQSITEGPKAEGDLGATRVPVGDIVKGTDEFDRLTKNLSDTGDLVRNPDGSIKVDAAGRPIVKTPAQANADHAKLADHVLEIYRNQPGLTGPHNPNGLKLVTDRPTTPGGKGRTLLRGQVVPDSVFDEIAASNQHNANQILNWRKMNGIMTRDDGTSTNAVYNTASTRKGRYATLGARERVMVPLYTEISPETKQVNFQMYDPEQMVKNVTRMMKTTTGKKLWNSVGPAYDDVRTYLDNLVNNRPGETGIGMEKKGVINEMFGINADANPFVSDVTKRPRSESVWKTMRLDRMNRVEELRDTRQVHSDTYEKVRSFMQPREAAAAPTEEPPMVAGQDLGNDGHREAIRATVGNPKAKDPVAKLDYGITSAPLLGGSAVSSTEKVTPGATPIDQARMDSQFKYLNGVERDRLQHLASNGAVEKLGNRIVKEFAKWKENPDIQAGMGWYSRMREKLRQAFGGDHDLFTQLLGATSARTPVDTNFLHSADAFQQYKAGKFDRHINEYLTSKQMREDGTMLDHALENNYQLPITDEKTGEVTGWRDPKSQAEAQAAYLGAKDAIPRQSNGQKFHANSMQVLKVLAGTWLDESKAPKTPNFAGNLSGRTLQATIDVWAARMLRRIGYEGKTGGQPWRILPKSETGVSNLDFAFSQLAMEHAAKKLGMNPDDFQAVAWFAEKHHWDNKGWTDTIGARKASFDEIFHLMYGGEKPLSVEQARSKIAELKAQKGYE